MKSYDIDDVLFDAFKHCRTRCQFGQLIYIYGEDKVELARKAVNSFYARRRRIRQRILEWLNSGADVYFVTLTVDDEHLSLGQDKLFSVAKAILRDSHLDYILNEDFGDRSGRYHLHATISSIDAPIFSWHYGFIDIRPMRTSKSDVYAVAQYVSKLAKHTCKATTARIAFSRSTSRKK